jgi:hypothetical protein
VDGVVPVAVELMTFDVDVRQLGVCDLDALG